MALFSMGAYLAADSVYAALLSEGDSSQLTLKYGGCARYYTGHFMDAIPLLESAYEGDTSAIDVCLLLGSALGRTYDRRRAFALFDRAEALMQPAPALTDMLTRFRSSATAKRNAPMRSIITSGRSATASICWAASGSITTTQSAPKRTRPMPVGAASSPCFLLPNTWPAPNATPS